MKNTQTGNTPPNAPSKTPNPSGGGRGNNPPKGKLRWASPVLVDQTWGEQMSSIVVRMMFLVAVICFGGSVYGADSSILGAWKLMSYVREDAATGETSRPWGEKPTGYLMYLPDGHMSAIITSEGRAAVAPTDEKFNEKMGQLLSTMAAYAGTYTVQGGKVIHHVEVAWFPSWVGSDQPREINLDGDTCNSHDLI